MQKFIGLSETEASQLAKQQCLKPWVFRENEPKVMTADRVRGRIVMTVSDGIVTDVSFPCGLDTFMPTLMSGKKIKPSGSHEILDQLGDQIVK